jgi:hypothetical protein
MKASKSAAVQTALKVHLKIAEASIKKIAFKKNPSLALVGTGNGNGNFTTEQIMRVTRGNAWIYRTYSLRRDRSK